MKRSDNLHFLKKGGCTSRVIDMVGIQERYDDDEIRLKPILKSGVFRSAFIVKHNVRPHERALVPEGLTQATKIIMPISATNLSSGGYSLFVEQLNFRETVSQFIGGHRENQTLFYQDQQRLDIIRGLPSFDPFLLREALKDYDDIDPRYFAMPQRDEELLINFSIGEMAPLVKIAFEGGVGSVAEKSRRLSDTLFRGKDGPLLDIFRNALRMDVEEYERGMFGWRGIMYYMWRVDVTSNDLRTFLHEIRKLSFRGATGQDLEMLNHCKQLIISSAGDRWKNLARIVASYRTRMDEFTNEGKPQNLRQFLLDAPELFAELGDDISAVEHVCSYWNFWRPKGQFTGLMPANEALDVLPEFCSSLAAAQIREASA